MVGVGCGVNVNLACLSLTWGLFSGTSCVLLWFSEGWVITGARVLGVDLSGLRLGSCGVRILVSKGVSLEIISNLGCLSLKCLGPTGFGCVEGVDLTGVDFGSSGMGCLGLACPDPTGSDWGVRNPFQINCFYWF